MIFVNEDQACNNGVYVIECVINNKKYVGSTFRKDEKGFKKRFNSYTKHPTTYYNKKLANAFKKYGYTNFIFKVIEIVNTSITDCRKKEEYYIAYYNSINNGYNIKAQAIGGNGGANKGKKYPTPSKELIKKRGDGVSKAMKGKKKSPEHRLAISLARLQPNYWGKKYAFLKNILTNEILMFRSRMDAAHAFNCGVSQVRSLLSGRSKILSKTFVKCTDEEIKVFLSQNCDSLELSKIRY
jgi:group I intron endonuclease